MSYSDDLNFITQKLGGWQNTAFKMYGICDESKADDLWEAANGYTPLRPSFDEIDRARRIADEIRDGYF